ncbi:MAG: hypothetical protein KAW41_01075 [Candidatus Diapherotrites archaeon]|nr:hypothetical protein [Candidatus Diapherotrites archaeon]
MAKKGGSGKKKSSKKRGTKVVGSNLGRRIQVGENKDYIVPYKGKDLEKWGAERATEKEAGAIKQTTIKQFKKTILEELHKEVDELVEKNKLTEAKMKELHAKSDIALKTWSEQQAAYKMAKPQDIRNIEERKIRTTVHEDPAGYLWNINHIIEQLDVLEDMHKTKARLEEKAEEQRVIMRKAEADNYNPVLRAGRRGGIRLPTKREKWERTMTQKSDYGGEIIGVQLNIQELMDRMLWPTEDNLEIKRITKRDGGVEVATSVKAAMDELHDRLSYGKNLMGGAGIEEFKAFTKGREHFTKELKSYIKDQTKAIIKLRKEGGEAALS